MIAPNAEMIVSIIAAMAESRIIGRDNALPWDLPADRKRFREITMGHPVIMGRKTFQSLAGPLQGRKNIVLTRQMNFSAEGCDVAHDLPQALKLAGETEEVFICGGAEVYRQALPLADRVYLTIIDRSYPGDTFFPELPADFVTSSMERVEGDPPFSFITYERATSKNH